MDLFRNGEHPTIIFCDGACSGNPGHGGWGTIVLNPDSQITELGGANPATTNNQMELTAAIQGLKFITKIDGKVHLFTDSVYVIRGITQWIWGWRRNGWKTATGNDVTNREYWEDLAILVSRRGSQNPIEWHFVRGHAGIPGNERVDEIAVSFTKKSGIKLYRGPLNGYSVALLDIPADTSLPPQKEIVAKKAAFSYISVVDGVANRHQTWTECERRVKGKSGARFKKTSSPEDEQELLAAWGVSITD